MDGYDVMMESDSGSPELGSREASRTSTDVTTEGVPVCTPASPSDLSHDDQAVLEVLAQHRGRTQAIGLDVVAALAGVTERTVQEAVARLIERHHYPIGSAVKKPMGYFFIETEAELAESLSQLVHRITSLARRIAALKHSTTPIVLNQLALEIEQDAA